VKHVLSCLLPPKNSQKYATDRLASERIDAPIMSCSSNMLNKNWRVSCLAKNKCRAKLRWTCRKSSVVNNILKVFMIHEPFVNLTVHKRCIFHKKLWCKQVLIILFSWHIKLFWSKLTQNICLKNNIYLVSKQEKINSNHSAPVIANKRHSKF
jgi:hypothetical protein